MVFPVDTPKIDRMLLTLAQEHPDLQHEIQQLSKSWIAAVMGQPSKTDKSQPRPFDYSKKKIVDVLKWRQDNRLLASDVQDRIHTDGDPKPGSKYAFEFGTGSLYWYGTDVDGCPNLWHREELLGWENVDIERRMECVALTLQSAINAMPPNIHSLNFILLLDNFNPINAVRHPRLGLTFLQTFMKCCPDRLKQAVMVTGTTGRIFYSIAKNFAPKSLVDKIKVVKNRRKAGKFMIEKGIVGGGASSPLSMHSYATLSSESSSSSDEEKGEDACLPDFLGGETVHKEEITKCLPLMIGELKERMAAHNVVSVSAAGDDTDAIVS